MDPNERDYSNGEITVHWQPSLCIHATTCYKELIQVFNPRNRPWVNMEGAPTDRIIEIVKKCPTRALSYDYDDGKRISDKPGGNLVPDTDQQAAKEKERPVEIRIMRDGPYVVEGNFSVSNSEGKELKTMKMTSFCRCGASESMPFCDGSHRIDNFSHSCE